jgi:hypothetical protein
VLTRPEEPQRCDWAAVGLELAGPGGALSGWDALRLRGLGGRRPPADPVLVLARRGATRRLGGVHVRGCARPYRTWRTSVDDPAYPYVEVASIPRAVSDFAHGSASRRAVRAVVTASVQAGECSPDELACELAASARNGSRSLRHSLGDVLDGARSAAEARAVARLRRAPVPAFELNVDLIDADGRLVAVADVLWRQLRAVLEIDSREFHFTERDWKATLARHNRLTARGLALTHYAPAVIVERSGDWLDEVVAWLRGRAHQLGVPYRPSGQVRRDPQPLLLP